MRRFVTTGCVCLALALQATAVLAAATPGSGDDPTGRRIAPPSPLLAWWIVDNGGGVSSSDAVVLVGSVIDPITQPLISTMAANTTLSQANAMAPITTDGLPTELALAPISPNPARGLARVSWALPSEGNVRIAVHDVQGRQVAVLADGSYAPGRYSVTWKPDRREGAAGIYFIRLQAMSRSLVQRLVMTP